MNDDTATIEELNQARRETAAEKPQAAPAIGTAAVSPVSVRLMAASKDGLDWVLDFILIGEIPFIGQVPGALFSLFIAYYLSRGGWFRGSKIRIALFALGFGLDNLPLVNNLPLTFLSVLF